MGTLKDLLLPWFLPRRRPLPWREEITPYRVWISEIMLQQTRIEAVIPYFRRFLDAFPTVAHLAAADDDKLNKCWEGLGYYSRARNLKKAAGRILTEYGGELPKSEEELLSLPGIGPYTAAAIASLAYGLPAPAVDGNVLRVYTRLMADGEDVSSPALRRRVVEYLRGEYPEAGEECRAMTEALMAVGQDVCLPNGRPNCAECPLRHICRAHGAGEETRYPNKPPKKARRKEKLTVLLLRHGERFALELRPDEGLLAGLWQFPNFGGHLSPEDTLEVAEGFALSPIGVTKLPPAAHIFTHVEWDMVGYLVECGTESDRFTFASPAEIRQTYPIASAFRLYRQIAAPEE